jgi:hypothetical protein
VDLLKRFDRADKRPVHGAFPIAEHTLGGQTRASLVVPASSRLVWTIAFPPRGVLRADGAVAGDRGPAAVSFRVGVSDDRVYETLAERVITATGTADDEWTPMAVDLSLYAGPKFSLFYRPDRRRWRLILATRIMDGSPDVAYWGAPGIDTDGDAARRFFKRQAASPR